jgi:hypothetical protein
MVWVAPIAPSTVLEGGAVILAAPAEDGCTRLAELVIPSIEQ